MEQNLQEKYNKLLNILRSTGGLAVAFSGGVDSAFLVYAAHEAHAKLSAARGGRCCQNFAKLWR